jgi:hypothetical protein
MFTGKARQITCVGGVPGWSAPGNAEALLHQLTMLVTADGKWVLPDSEEFLAALGDPEPDYDACGFAVRNLGFIKFQVLDRLVTEIELCPRHVELQTLTGLERLLDEAGTNLVRIRYFDTDWHSEISSSIEHSVGRLHELCARPLDPAPAKRFQADPKNLSELFDTSDGRSQAFGRLAMKWRVAFGNFDPAVMSIASRNDLLPRLVIVGFESKTTRPILRFFGERHRWAGDRFRVNGIGRPVDAMPDKEYGAWLRQFYEWVASTGQPRYDLVTAEMEYHSEAGATRRLARYERLLLPWRTRSDEMLVTACTKVLSDEGSANLRESGSDSTLVKNS